MPFPVVRGRVFLEKKAPFAYPGEVLKDHGQLPQFYPRIKSDDKRQYLTLAKSQKYANDEGGPEIREKFGALQPMPAFRTSHQPHAYNDLDWWLHINRCNDMYNRTEDLGLDVSEMSSLIAMASYGMGHSMTWLKPFLIVTHSKDFERRVEARPEFSGMKMATGKYDWDRVNWDRVDGGDNGGEARSWGKRWIVAPVHHEQPQGDAEEPYCHALMSIFDRQCGHLYIFDASHGGGELLRDERIQAVVQVWAMFWNSVGLPYHFQYFVSRGTPQPGDFECGWIAVFWLMQVLRNQVGEQLLAPPEDVELDPLWFRDMPIGNYEPENYPYEDSSLYLRDWKPDSCATAAEGVQFMFQVYDALLRNELGLDPHGCAETLDPICKSNKNRPVGDQRIRSSQFWTSLGGRQFVLPLGVDLDSDELAYESTAPRRHLAPLAGTPPSFEDDWYPMDGSPSVHNPRVTNVPPTTAAYTRDNPLLPRNHPPKVGVGRNGAQWYQHALAVDDAGYYELVMDVHCDLGTDETGASKGNWKGHAPLRLLMHRLDSVQANCIRLCSRACFLGNESQTISTNAFFDIWDGTGPCPDPPSSNNGPPGGGGQPGAPGSRNQPQGPGAPPGDEDSGPPAGPKTRHSPTTSGKRPRPSDAGSKEDRNPKRAKL